jgi:SAM-dependent methyltransferase
MKDPVARARSFGPAADRYDALRPSYPPAALSWALGARPLRVADLGAGTGILTRVLLSLGHSAVPVEPDEAMRARLERATPGAFALAGSAEAIPLPEASVDAAVAGQAYHWFDPPRANEEIARVVRPGGVFAPLWNLRDESVPWVAALSALLEEDRGDGTAAGTRSAGLAGLEFGPRFGPVERAEFRHAVAMTADTLVALVTTRSYYLTASAERRAEIEARVRALAAGLPEAFELPYVTLVLRAERRP